MTEPSEPQPPSGRLQEVPWYRDCGLLAAVCVAVFLCLPVLLFVGMSFWGAPLAVVGVYAAVLLVVLVAVLSSRYRYWALAVILIGVLAALLLPAGSPCREATRRSNCFRNLRQIGLALHHYHDAYKCFPPPHVVDQDGRPLYSWRILILPFLDRQDLYEQWRLDEPWDSSHNRPLAEQKVKVFQCPSVHHAAEAFTSYLAVVGPGMAWEQGKCLTVRDFPDSVSDTIMVVEIAGAEVNWAAPVDMDRAAMSPAINDEPRPSISSRHPGVANVLFADGSVKVLGTELEVEIVEALLTRDGGEPIDWGAF